MTSLYPAAYAAWQSDPEAFWRKAAEEIDWISPPVRIFDAAIGPYGHWFPDATCNTCFNAVDRHVRDGRGDQAAIIHDSPVTASTRTLTFSQVLAEVSTLAAVLQDHGVA